MESSEIEPTGACFDEKKTANDGEEDSYIGTCMLNRGNIMDVSCRGPMACASNRAPIGKSSCTGAHACHENAQTIRDDACHGESSCFGNIRYEMSTCKAVPHVFH